MTLRLCIAALLCLYSVSALAVNKTSVSLVDRPDDANELIYISDRPLGYGDTLFVTDRDPGYGKTFYFTNSMSDADIVLKKPWESPRAAALRLYIYNQNPGYATSIYVTEDSVGYGTPIYFAEGNPGHGKALYVEDEQLRGRRKALAVMLMLLGEI